MANEVITINENVATENELLAAKLFERFNRAGVYVVNLLGTAGAGKTSFLIRLIEELGGERTYVIEGDVASNIDTDKLRSLGIDAYQITTGGTCHLNAAMIEGILSKMSLDAPGLLFIENIGNLICPAEYAIGEHLRLVASSVPEGSDKPYKYPTVFRRAHAVVITKSDLSPYIDYDVEYFTKGVRSLNPEVPIFEASAKAATGFAPVAEWLRARIARELPAAAATIQKTHEAR